MGRALLSAVVAFALWSCDARQAPSGVLGADGDSCLDFRDCLSQVCFDGVCGLPMGGGRIDCAPPGGSCGACCEGLVCRDGFCRSAQVVDPPPSEAICPDDAQGECEPGEQVGDEVAGEGEGEGESAPLLEENTEGDCQDEIDNDDDGRIDCLDEGCLNTVMCRLPGRVRESRDAPAGSCDDGIDNDGDGDTDCEDEPCRNTRECLE